MLIENRDYFVRVVKLPHTIRGVTSTNPDGTYSIYLNSRNTYAQEQVAKSHELRHIANDDFNSNLPIADIEQL